YREYIAAEDKKIAVNLANEISPFCPHVADDTRRRGYTGTHRYQVALRLQDSGVRLNYVRFNSRCVDDALRRHRTFETCATKLARMSAWRENRCIAAGHSIR
ncbi:hypothetical protein, partial [Paraburkholderia sediminicola]|uniref:hypothetical protein n=1 Tax=Paraburkholderia sediminicola TaxID=458836 RepID=UPI0038BB7987